ncbi:hypothetical protein P7K49_026215, partial [Saguinus oedipus]
RRPPGLVPRLPGRPSRCLPAWPGVLPARMGEVRPTAGGGESGESPEPRPAHLPVLSRRLEA